MAAPRQPKSLMPASTGAGGDEEGGDDLVISVSAFAFQGMVLILA